MCRFFKLKRLFSEFTIVAFLLMLHFFLVFTAAQRKSPVFDEPVHIAGGLSYWLENDYRINPENGNFPQRWAAIPLIFQNVKFPDLRKIPLRQTDEWTIAGDFIYKSGNSPEKILTFSRAMITILSLVTGMAVYFYSKKLFGIGGGLISLALYALCPEILAHAGFATSDMAAAMAFILTLICIWSVLNRITVKNIIFSSLALSLLFVTKFSAFIIIPVYLILILIRLKSKRHIECVLFSRRIIVDTQVKQLRYYSIVLIVNLFFILFFIWMSYGFRFTMLKVNNTSDGKTITEVFGNTCKSCGPPGKALLAAKEMKLLPEAYLYGFAFVLSKANARNSFLNGELSTKGWWYFFLYSFMTKTPIPLILLFGMSIYALFWKRILHNDKLFMLIPFFVFILIYFLFAISSKLNIGNRHLLPIYPCIFVICGSTYYTLQSKLPIRILTAFLIAWFILESYKIRPHYLAYFNQFAGGAANGYRHLSDSSLDWGQDLKELRRWIDVNNKKNEKVYLSYFGTANIGYYMRDYKQLPCYFEQARRADDFFELKGGIYCISATMFQFTYYNTGLSISTGLNPAQISENLFIEIYPEIKKFIKDKSELSITSQVNEKAEKLLPLLYDIYDYLRFAKLCLYLRLHREKPDAYAGYSILIYRLSDKEVEEALAK